MRKKFTDDFKFKVALNEDQLVSHAYIHFTCQVGLRFLRVLSGVPNKIDSARFDDADLEKLAEQFNQADSYSERILRARLQKNSRPIDVPHEEMQEMLQDRVEVLAPVKRQCPRWAKIIADHRDRCLSIGFALIGEDDSSPPDILYVLCLAMQGARKNLTLTKAPRLSLVCPLLEAVRISDVQM